MRTSPSATSNLLAQLFQFLAAEELDDVGFQLAVLGAHPGHALGAERRRDLLGVLVLQHVLAELVGLALDVDALDAAAALQDLLEDGVVGMGEDIRHIHEAQAEAQVGTVGAGGVHGLVSRSCAGRAGEA